MKTAELRDLSTAELTARLKDIRLQLQKLVLDHAVAPLERPSDIQRMRRDIARMKTLLRERELEAGLQPNS